MYFVPLVRMSAFTEINVTVPKFSAAEPLKHKMQLRHDSQRALQQQLIKDATGCDNNIAGIIVKLADHVVIKKEHDPTSDYFTRDGLFWKPAVNERKMLKRAKLTFPLYGSQAGIP